jgi:hypothetical protein
MPARHLPAQPNVRQLRQQAKDLLRALRAQDPDAIGDFRLHHPEGRPHDARLSDAQLVLARSYGASSWPRLVAICTLIEALTRGDLETVRALVSADEALAIEYERAPLSGWRATMSTAATRGLERIVAMLRQAGAGDVDAARSRHDLQPWLDTLRRLGRLGARFPPHAIGGAVESLSGANFAFMVEIGTPIEDEHGDWRSRIALALETYARHPEGKHRILAVAARGIPLPDSPPMAVHRGDMDLLAQWLQRDPRLLERTFTHEEFFPPDLGCHADHALALVGAPLDGATLLHMAADYEEVDIVRWLLDRGMNPDVRAALDADGFGGHTPLFNCIVTYNAGRRDDRIVRLLLDRGADPNVRASIRMRLPFARDTAMHEYRDVTPLGWAQGFHDQTYVSEPARRALTERGGAG